jgi:hypothetical protein
MAIILLFRIVIMPKFVNNNHPTALAFSAARAGVSSCSFQSGRRSLAMKRQAIYVEIE